LGAQLTILSFGSGQDSATLLAMYRHDPEFRKKYAPGQFVVVFSDTGNEHPKTYEYAEEINHLCLREGIEFWWLKPDMGFHYPNWHTLDQQMDTHGTVFSKAFPKSCTDKLKVQVIYRWLAHWIEQNYDIKNPEKKYRGKAPIVAFVRSFGKIRILLGIAAGEEKRVSKAQKSYSKWSEICLDKVYPLMDLGLDRQRCQDYLRSVNETVPWPSCCLKCPWANLQELLWLSMDFPDVYQDWVRQERVKLDRNKDKGDKNCAVWGSTKTLPEMLEIAKQKHGDMTLEQLREYRFSHGHCNNSAY
jgi:hypothetical protein